MSVMNEDAYSPQLSTTSCQGPKLISIITFAVFVKATSFLDRSDA
jgi:hypothetical protein